MNDLLPQNPTYKQRKAFNKRQIEIKIAADEQIRKISMEGGIDDTDSDSKKTSSDSSALVSEEIQLSSQTEGTTGRESGSFIIQLDGVRFKRNDECEFRRVVIQNFIKRGNLGPLTDCNGSSRKTSLEGDVRLGTQTEKGSLDFVVGSAPGRKQVLSNFDRSSLLQGTGSETQMPNHKTQSGERNSPTAAHFGSAGATSRTDSNYQQQRATSYQGNINPLQRVKRSSPDQQRSSQRCLPSSQPTQSSK